MLNSLATLFILIGNPSELSDHDHLRTSLRWAQVDRKQSDTPQSAQSFPLYRDSLSPKRKRRPTKFDFRQPTLRSEFNRDFIKKLLEAEKKREDDRRKALERRI